MEDELNFNLLTSPGWNQKLEKVFRLHDANKDGLLTMDEFLNIHVKQQTNALAVSDDLKYKLAITMASFACYAGFMPDSKMTLKQFKMGIAKLASHEEIKRKSGAKTLLDHWTDAYFDLIDQREDAGLTLEQLSVLWRNTGITTKDSAKKTFEAVDIDGDGRVTRDEMKKRNHMFWYTENIKDVSGLYGITLE